jgi:hypothetical protein
VLNRETLEDRVLRFMIAEDETVSEVLAINNGSVSPTFRAHDDRLAIETHVPIPDSYVGAGGNEYDVSRHSRDDPGLDRGLIGRDSYRCSISACS